MNWQTKAKIQNLVASLPAAVADPVYYFIQRRFGGLRTINPLDSIRYSVQLATLIMAQDRDIAGKTILELGTGRRLNLPLVFWLCGADRLVTIDLNKYLKEELVIEDLAYIKANTEQISGLFPTFAECPLFQERWALLLEMPPRLSELQKRLNIEYLAPCDARHLPDYAIDYYVSNSVLEHIPPEVMVEIFQESQRVLQPNGLSVHLVNFSDHFELDDKSITRINFLQYSEAEWQRLAGNQYMYHNRLRIPDYLDIFHQVGLHVIHQQPHIDQASLAALEAGFPVHEKFRNNSHQVNATAGAAFVLAPR